MKKAGEEANRKLKGVLGDDQYQLMVRKNYDLKLGIKMPEKIFPGKDSNEKAP